MSQSQKDYEAIPESIRRSQAEAVKAARANRDRDLKIHLHQRAVVIQRELNPEQIAKQAEAQRDKPPDPEQGKTAAPPPALQPPPTRTREVKVEYNAKGEPFPNAYIAEMSGRAKTKKDNIRRRAIRAPHPHRRGYVLELVEG